MTEPNGIIFTGEKQVIYDGFQKLPDPKLPRRGLANRLLKHRPWRIDVRLRPLDMDLQRFGDVVSGIFKVPYHENDDPENKAIWLVGSGWYRDEVAAMTATAKLLERELLDGPDIAAVQIAATEMRRIDA